MKKLISIVLAMTLLVTAVFAAALPGFLTQPYTNYTADYSISVSFDNSEEVINLLKELEIPDEVNNYVDLNALLESLFTCEEKMILQADISSNYEKIKIGITGETQQNIDVNMNLNVTYNVKTGMWMDIDMSDASNPVFDIIYSYPLLNKYLKISADDILDEQTTGILKMIFNKEFIESTSKTGIELFAKHATIEGSGTTYTLSMDNAGFTAYVDDAVSCMASGIMPAGEEYNPYAEFPSIKGMQILGEDGIKAEINLNGTTIVSEKVTTDISLDVAQIYKLIADEEWPYESLKTLDFTVNVAADVSNVGTTTVSFPVLTDENTVLFEEIFPYYNQDYDDYEPTPQYPIGSVYGSATGLPVVEGNVYVPLRKVLEKAYGDSISINYDNGVITAESEYFPGFTKLVITIGSDKIYAGDIEYTISEPILENGTTYVDAYMFEDIFEWTLSYVTYDFVDGAFSYRYYTY